MAINNGLTELNVMTLGASGSNVLATAYNSSVFISTNSGNSWTQSSIYGISSFAFSGNNIFAVGLIQNVFLSTNNGANWININNGLLNQFPYCIAVSGSNLIVGTTYDNSNIAHGIFISTNLGTNWIPKNDGFCNSSVNSFLVTGNNIYAATIGTSVWKRLLSEIFGIKQINSKIPAENTLYQNYPNPFNPATIIKFAISKTAFAKLIIYDVLGREVTTLVNEQLKPGNYEVTFDGTNFASGIYFYRIEAGSYVETMKMILIK